MKKSPGALSRRPSNSQRRTMSSSGAPARRRHRSTWRGRVGARPGGGAGRGPAGAWLQRSSWPGHRRRAWGMPADTIPAPLTLARRLRTERQPCSGSPTIAAACRPVRSPGPRRAHRGADSRLPVLRCSIQRGHQLAARQPRHLPPTPQRSNFMHSFYSSAFTSCTWCYNLAAQGEQVRQQAHHEITPGARGEVSHAAHRAAHVSQAVPQRLQ